MYTFQGIAIDAGVSIDGDCTVTRTVTLDCIEIEFGQHTGSLNLCLTEDAAIKVVDAVTLALADFRHHRDTATCPN